MKEREITVSGKTLDDAITEALIELGVTSDQLDYDVIEKGSSGFLGIGVKQAVITARKKRPEEKKPEVKPEAKKEVKSEVKKEEKPVAGAAKETEKEVVKAEKKQPVKASKTEDKKASVKEERELVKVEDATIESCKKFLSDVLAAMGMEVNLTAGVDSEGALAINMDGKNMGLLIGKRGQTLDSLQYLTNRVANKAQEGYVRVKLDTENYRSRRKDTLESLAKNIAYKVKRTRQTVALEPMNPYERRIIHSVLQGDKYVATHSEGEEPYRHVVISLNRKDK